MNEKTPKELYKNALTRIYWSADGKMLFEWLSKSVENAPLLESDPQKTAYNIGQRDLVILLKKYALEPELDKVGD